jgi:2-polyprenyl-3-methyl-5-hydroxy-6-metoxy-1,4-benzoquinol methylase
MTAELIDFTKPQPYVAAAPQYVKSGSMLDLGAGWGRNAQYFADHGFDVTAVDNLSEAVARLKSYRTSTGQGIKTICADIRTFTSHDTYDAVLCTMVLHQRPSPAGHYHAAVVYAVQNSSYNRIIAMLNHMQVFDMSALDR